MDFKDIYLNKLCKSLRNIDLGKVEEKKYLSALSSEDLIEGFRIVFEKLAIASKIMNLTSITDPEGVCEKHILDSILPFVILNNSGIITESSKIADVGTGAGFPAVPLSLLSERCDAFPSFSVTGIDSTGKKISYINELSGALGLSNLTAIQTRAEVLGQSPARGSFDIACARALSELRKLLELSAPLIRIGGYIAALKAHAGEEIENAENAANVLGLKFEKTIEYCLPEGDFRSVVIYKKIKDTPSEYPRNYSRISSNPL